MRRVTIHAPNDVRKVEATKPLPGPKDAVIKVEACGICGSDLGYVAMGGLPLADSGPMPLGHELAGTVDSVGQAVDAVKPGERVVVNPEAAGNRIGNGGTQGGFAPYLLVRNVTEDECLYTLPDTLSFEQGALVEPLAVSMHAVNQCELRPDDRVVIFGAGPIGLGIIVCMRYRGVRNIVAVDYSRKRLAIAAELGADAVLDLTDGEPWDDIRAAHGQELALGFIPVVGSDVFIDASGAATVVRGVVDNAKFGARLVVVGVHKTETSLHFLQVMMKELTIRGSMAYPNEFQSVIDMLSSGDVDPSPIVTHRFDYDDFEAALETAKQSDKAGKVMVNLAGEHADGP